MRIPCDQLSVSRQQLFLLPDENLRLPVVLTNTAAPAGLAHAPFPVVLTNSAAPAGLALAPLPVVLTNSAESHDRHTNFAQPTRALPCLHFSSSVLPHRLATRNFYARTEPYRRSSASCSGVSLCWLKRLPSMVCKNFPPQPGKRQID